MIKTSYQTPELRDSNDNIVQEGAFGKNTALSNSTNDGWIDYVVNNLEALHDTIGDSAATLDGNGHVVEPCNLAIGDEDGNRLKTSYLKLSGGTVAGTLNVQQNLKFQDNQENVFGGVYVPSSSSTEQYAQFYGGESISVAGAKLTLFPDGDGRFKLDARSTDGANTYTLVTDNNGNLNWRGYPLGWAKDYVRLDGTTKMPNPFIRIASNLDPASSTRTEARAISLQDKNGTAISDLFSSTFVNYSFTGVRTMRSIDGTTNWADIRLVVNSDGTYHAEYAKSSELTLSVRANSGDIPTTAWTDAKYLPLAGGTMTGAIIRRGDFVFCNADDSFVRISGSSEYTHGASLQLNGQDGSSNGRFALMARKSGVGAPILMGDPDGTLTWGGTQLAYETSAIRAVSSLASTSGNNTATFTMRGNSALIAVKRGANAQLFMCDYWTANSVTLSSVGSAIATVTKTANSNTVTITNTSSSAISVQIVSGANLL